MNKNNSIFWTTFLLLLALSSCKKNEDVTPDCKLAPTTEEHTFEFTHPTTGDTFLAWTSDTLVLSQVEAQLALPIAERGQHINGVILRLSDNCSGINQKWSWYFAPDDWTLADISIELCDGNPQYVEENLDEYIDVIGRYCPWGAVVLREVEN